jgi:lipopolysaccharide export system protein LptA
MGAETVKNGRILITCLLLLLFAAFPQGVGAAEKGAEKGKQKTEGEFPLHITAAKLEADQKEGIIIFTGNVKAVYGDSTLYSDQLRVYFQTSPKGAPAPGQTAPPAKEEKTSSPLGDLGGEKITHIVAQGQVRMVQEDRVATGQEGIFYKDKEEVVLTGNPQLWRGENTLKGEKIIFYLKTNRVLVESSPQRRVEAHLYPSNQGAGGTKGALPLSPKAKKGRQP